MAVWMVHFTLSCCVRPREEEASSWPTFWRQTLRDFISLLYRREANEEARNTNTSSARRRRMRAAAYALLFAGLSGVIAGIWMAGLDGLRRGGLRRPRRPRGGSRRPGGIHGVRTVLRVGRDP